MIFGMAGDIRGNSCSVGCYGVSDLLVCIVFP